MSTHIPLWIEAQDGCISWNWQEDAEEKTPHIRTQAEKGCDWTSCCGGGEEFLDVRGYITRSTFEETCQEWSTPPCVGMQLYARIHKIQSSLPQNQDWVCYLPEVKANFCEASESPRAHCLLLQQV
jgi:hypothetical protein